MVDYGLFASIALTTAAVWLATRLWTPGDIGERTPLDQFTAPIFVAIVVGRAVTLMMSDLAGLANLREFLTVEAFRALVPDSDGLEIRRYELPNIRSINFVVAGLLGEGVSSTARMDAQAKSLGEYVRAKVIDIPVELLENPRA